MYFKLAFKNVKKSYKDFLIYFLTLAFSVCLFYTFNGFQEQKAVLEMSSTQISLVESINTIMGMLSSFVSVVLAFLILYANNFLIKRRKKEFGLYTLLGMPKSNISRVLVYETFIIGLLSLVTGMGLGLILSQLLTIVTASMFTVTLNYHFIFSIDSALKTMMCFGIIFLCVMVLNSFVLNRYKLIDLLTADRKNETFKTRNLYVSVLLFILSLLLLGYAYHEGLDKGMLFIESLSPIILAGCAGTVLFFMSLAGFLLKFIQTSKHLYYRNLNMFVLRQINAKINSNFLSMSVICIMLLLSIGALATGLNLRGTINSTMELTTPFDYSYRLSQYDIKDFNQLIGLDEEKYLSAYNYINVYETDEINSSDLTPYITTKSTRDVMTSGEFYLELIKLSEYNKNALQQGLHEISLKQDEMYMFTSTDMVKPYLDEIIDNKAKLDVFNHTLTNVSNTDYEFNNIATNTSVGTITLGIVVPDDVIPNDVTISRSYFNADLKDGVSEKEFAKHMTSLINNYQNTHSEEEMRAQGIHIWGINDDNLYGEMKSVVRENSVGLSVLFTYIGIYLGIVFLIASAVILALQQLSQADENRSRYMILGKIGAEAKMMNHSIFLQIGIYFFMPLLLAIAHSIIGIKVVNSVITAFGRSDIFSSSLSTMAIILVIYGGYFLLTYFGYQRILKQKN